MTDDAAFPLPDDSSTHETRITPAERAAHDAATIDALIALAPDAAGAAVAGLFAHGRELCARPAAQGLAFFIGHAGREVTRGIVALLAGAAVHPQPQRSSTAADSGADADADERETKDNFRDVLAGVLGISRESPVVGRWFDLHGQLVAACHFRSPAPALSDVRALFTEFSELLYGLVGPYFEIQSELDSLASLDTPSVADVQRVIQRLSRPAQRQRFFSRAKAGWVGPPSTAKFFRRPPDRRVEPDGGWRATPWPEGEFLERSAAEQPATVAAILRDTPRDLQNPVVWEIVTRAALALPIDEAITLTSLLVHALKNAPPIIFAHTLIDLVTRFASSGKQEALKIAEALLWPAPAPNEGVGEDHKDDAAFASRCRELLNQHLFGRDWMFARINSYEFTRFREDALPVIIALDAAKTLKILVEVVAKVDRRLLRLAACCTAEPGTTIDTSRRWSTDLVRGDGYSNDLEQLALAVKAAALALANGTPEEAPHALPVLESRDVAVLNRIRLLVFAAAGPKVQDALDRAISDPRTLSPGTMAAEVAHLLREQFHNASPEVRAALATTLTAGPDEETISRTLRFYEQSDTAETRAREVARWQSRRLRWFHDRIPAELSALAKELGMTGVVPDRRQQALDEVGSWSSGVVSRSERSPVDSAQLLALSAAEAFDFLASWEPSAPISIDDYPASREGLARSVYDAAAVNPDAMRAWASHLASAPLSPQFIQAVLGGLHQAVREKRIVDVDIVEAFARAAFTSVQQASVLDASPESEFQYARWASIEAVQLLDALAELEGLTAMDVQRVMAILTGLPDKTIVVVDEHAENEIASLEDALHAGFSTLAGQVFESMFVLVVGEARRAFGDRRAPEQFPATTQLLSLSERLLALPARSGIGVRSALGKQLPGIHWLAPSWSSTRLSAELDASLDNAVIQPTFPAYLAHSRVYRGAFEWLRPWYLRLTVAEELRHLTIDGRATLGGALLRHVVGAITLGLATAGDGDDLVVQAFEHATEEDTQQAYWMIFRSWSDLEMDSADVVAWLERAAPRIVQLWVWRLSILENAGPQANVAGEVDSLLWLLATPHLPAQDSLRLGWRTVKLMSGKSRTAGSVWGRLSDLAHVDAAGAFAIAERLIELELRSDFAYLPFEDVSSLLCAAVDHGGEIRRKAMRLINKLGEHGHGEFEPLYPRVMGADSQNLERPAASDDA